MNRVVLMGRLTKDPDVKYTQAAEPMAIARYTLAVDRRGKHQEGQQNADFISCVAFGRNGEFAEKYLKKGTKVCVEGHIQTGSYTNKDGQRVYTTDVAIDSQEFCESRAAAQDSQQKADTGPWLGIQGDIHSGFSGATPAAKQTDITGFMQVPDDISEELPFT